MRCDQWIKLHTSLLSEAGIVTARLDCLVLLEDTINKDRSWLLAHPECIIPSASIARLNSQIKRRMRHEPLAQIRGKTEFYGRDFFITSDVLEPRPESEVMIELLKEISPTNAARIIDVGCGSGVLGITASLEIPSTIVTLTDIDPGALKVSERNVKEYQIAVNLRQGDLLENNDEPYDIVLANLPYVPDDYPINTAATHEPRLAIFGGHDGLDLYRRLFQQLRSRSVSPRYILVESLLFQHTTITKLALDASYKPLTSKDLIQAFIKFDSLAL